MEIKSQATRGKFFKFQKFYANTNNGVLIAVNAGAAQKTETYHLKRLI